MVTLDGKVYIETHFTKEEMECSCGCGVCPTDEAVLRLEYARVNATKQVGNEFPFFVTCGARCVKHNDEIGGTPGSKHIPPDCCAFDIGFSNTHEASIIVAECYKAGFTSCAINFKKQFIHVDMRPKKHSQVWSY